MKKLIIINIAITLQLSQLAIARPVSPFEGDSWSGSAREDNRPTNSEEFEVKVDPSAFPTYAKVISLGAFALIVGVTGSQTEKYGSKNGAKFVATLTLGFAGLAAAVGVGVTSIEKTRAYLTPTDSKKEARIMGSQYLNEARAILAFPEAAQSLNLAELTNRLNFGANLSQSEKNAVVAKLALAALAQIKNSKRLPETMQDIRNAADQLLETQRLAGTPDNRRLAENSLALFAAAF